MSSQAMFARLAAAMRKAVKRKIDESDSDDSIDIVTNRGNKLRKKARYVREGKLAPPSGPEVYRRTITHAGYERAIISRRPPVYDDDGYEVDSEDDDESAQAARAAAAEFYPYSEVKIEEILAPLTRPADLPDHPTLSRPFTSKPLTELTRQARDMVAKEKASLWRMKHLLTLMSGDHTWAPCGVFETDEDILLFSNGQNDYREHILEKARLKMANEVPSYVDMAEKTIAAANSALEDGHESLPPLSIVENAVADIPITDNDVVMVDALAGTKANGNPEIIAAGAAELSVEIEPATTNEQAASMSADGLTSDVPENVTEIAKKEEKLVGEVPESNLDEKSVTSLQEMELDGETKRANELPNTIADDEEALPYQEEIPEPRRMRTRAQAQAASDDTTISRPRSATPSTNTSYIHPYFLAPASARPIPDMGLPPVEAEETRRLLQLYIQKQEEICRGSQKVYDGLLKAERLRKTVYQWAKADGHVGEMSDGEDWYDKEEWGLSEDLKKGQDEEEEDAATTAKKTRTRRQ